MHLKNIPAVFLSFLFATPAFSQVTSALTRQLADCSRLADASGRLSCFDRLAAAHGAGAAAPQPTAAADQHASASPAAAQPAPAALRGPAIATTMDAHWELNEEQRRGIFVFRPHQPNYLIAARTYRPNEAPYAPFRAANFTGELSHAELQYQIGFKMKAVETAFDLPVDLWFAYTQNSFWQAANREASSPFRETNYQPEIMLVTPLNFSVLGANVKYLNLGLNHLSNGQSSSLSRSWNRVYAQVGLERGRLALTARVWKRVEEALEDDNNPNIVDYLGRVELSGSYRMDGHEFSAMLRRNLSTDKSATQLGWAFPLAGPLKGYVHWFSGYGQSLIDYDYFQRTIGVGVVVRY